MAFESISFHQFRCLKPGGISLDPGLNFLVGDNGSGKSSFIEACIIALTGRSFRTRQLALAVAHDTESARIQAKLNGNFRIDIELFSRKSKPKRIHINEKVAKSAAQLARLCPVQLISPETFHLIDSAPAQRRQFLDWLLFHVEHQYSATWRHYHDALKQRNALLRSARPNAEVFKELDFWDARLAEFGETIDALRSQYTLALYAELADLLNGTEIDHQQIRFHYKPGFKDSLLTALRSHRESDRLRGFTQYGCHKADIGISYNGIAIKELFSRGQKKLLINLLFIAQLRLLKKITAKPSVFMIDDFTSELDKDNQGILLRGLRAEKDLQIIITGLTIDAAKEAGKVYNSGHMFHVERGSISEINDSI